MSVVLITGSSGLIGSESAQYFHGKGFEVWGIDNNMRRYFFWRRWLNSMEKRRTVKA